MTHVPDFILKGEQTLKKMRKMMAAALSLTMCAGLACPALASNYTVVKGDS